MQNIHIIGYNSRMSKENRFKTAIAALALLPGLSLTGCNNDEETTRNVSITALPDKLPEGVKDIVDSAVRITISGERRFVQSGVKIEGDIFTAGHGFRDDNNKPLQKTCPLDISIETSSNQYTKQASVTSRLTSQDLARIQPLDPLDIPDATIAKIKPKVGDPLFFVNFQKENTKEKNTRGINKLAIFGGIFAGKEQGDIVVFTTKNYGDPPDTEMRLGGSGGAVFNVFGHLVGVSTDSYEKLWKVKKIEEQFNIDITDKKSGDKLPGAAVERITNDTLKQFKKIRADSCVN